MKRFVEEELLDSDQGTPEEVARCLEDLRGINRSFGGNALHKRLLTQVAASLPANAPLHLLEVAAGRADVLQYAALDLQAKGHTLQLTLLDRCQQHLPMPDYWSQNLPAPKHILGDALHIPLEENSVDVVSCCLFVHHLEPEEASAFLRETLRVARIAVVINDLERRRDHWVLANLGRFIFRSHLTTHDAPVSVRRAYTLDEMRTLLNSTGHRSELFRAPVYRLGGVVWKY
ncbi:MAG: methyltransferase domain-containing protein [Acidobacteriaceae bacterium]